ncbi:MAG: hypothetical protein MN733_40385, partial [Nitrososphaera sp.]|nr:hypothetical protein [Nitrososphaera sp.]
VCHEIGIGIALGKCCYRIKNDQHSCPAPDEAIGTVLSSLKYQAYQCNPSATCVDSIAPSDTQAIEDAIRKLTEQFRKLSKAKRNNVNPFKTSAELHLIQKPDTTTVFLFSDKSASMWPWTKDFSNQIREDLGLGVSADPGTSYDGPEALKYLQLAARSTHCIIDVTNKNRFAWFLVGFSEGFERRPLAAWKQGTDSMITDYRGQASNAKYDNKDELWHTIKQFIAG